MKLDIDLHKEYDVYVVSGVEGPSVYVNDTRMAGPKPWGGGKTIYSWKTRGQDVLDCFVRDRVKFWQLHHQDDGTPIEKEVHLSLRTNKKVAKKTAKKTNKKVVKKGSKK